jgi:hypothetical protein
MKRSKLLALLALLCVVAFCSGAALAAAPAADSGGKSVALPKLKSVATPSAVASSAAASAAPVDYQWANNFAVEAEAALGGIRSYTRQKRFLAVLRRDLAEVWSVKDELSEASKASLAGLLAIYIPAFPTDLLIFDGYQAFMQTYAPAWYIEHLATEQEIETQEPSADGKGVSLDSFRKASKRIGKAGLVRAKEERIRQREGAALKLLLGTGNYAENYQTWFREYIKSLPSVDGITALEKEIKGLSLVPQTPARDAFLQFCLTTREILKQLN